MKMVNRLLRTNLRWMKALNLVLILSMMLTALPVNTLAAQAASASVETFQETEDVTIKVHFKNANNWDNVFAYALEGDSWTAIDGYTQYSTWPGAAVEENVLNDGYYSMTIVKDTSKLNFIFNNNNGSQTADLAIDAATLAADEDGFVEVWATPDNEVSDTAPEGWTSDVTVRAHFDNSVNWSSVYAYTWTDAGTTNGSWPGTQISENADHAGFYTVEKSQSPDSTFNFIFNNGSGTQTADLKVEAATLAADADGLVEVWADAYNNVSYTAPESWTGGEAVKPDTADITIHFANSAAWSSVYVYSWLGSGGNPHGSWPGTQLTENAAHAGYFTVETTQSVTTDFNFIFNNNSGNQTADLKIDAATLAADEDGKVEVWATPDNTVSYTAPEGWVSDEGDSDEIISPEINGSEVTFRYQSDTASAVYLAGSMNGWSATATPMTKDADGIFTVTLTLDPGSYTYKFVVDGSWVTDPNNDSTADDGYGGSNSSFVIEGSASVISPEVNGNEVTFRYQSTTASAVYLAGTMNGWSTTATPLTKGDDGVFSVTLTLEAGTHEYKYVVDDNWLNDPLNSSYADNGNNTVVVEGSTEEPEENYNITIYYYDSTSDRMDIEKSALWIWDKANNGSGSEYAFTGKEGLADGRTWLKAELTLGFGEEIGIIAKSKGDWSWQTADLIYTNTDDLKDVTLYIVYGQNEVFTSLADVPEGQQECFVLVEYTRDDEDYTDCNIYTWNNGYAAEVVVDFAEIDGKYVAKIPVTYSDEDKTLSFIVRKGYDWDSCVKDGGDNHVVIPADQSVVKVRYYNGAVTEVLPYNSGSYMDAAAGRITFYYRDDALFADCALDDLAGKVQIVVNGETYVMEYNAEEERFVYSMEMEEGASFYYYYLADGVKIMDAYNDLTGTYNGESCNVLHNKEYFINLTAEFYYDSMDYNDSNVLTVAYAAVEGAEADSLEGFEIVEVYADFSALGWGSKVAIDPALLEISAGCAESTAAGTKTVTVTLVDNCGKKHTASAEVKVTARENTAADFDWDEAVIYFAVTDRFFDGNTDNNNATAGYDVSGGSTYHGGDLAGLTAKLDYLEELGVNTIWLTPIVDNIDRSVNGSFAYHGYWASDFTTLNPHLGTEEELQALIDAAHEKNMKIMVDVVLNHAGYGADDNFVITDSEGNEISMIRGSEDTVNGDTILSSVSGLPDFLTENEAVREQLIDWQTNWVEKYGIDYYRVDTVKHVDNTTWSAFKNELTKIDPDFKLIGEYYGAGTNNTAEQLGTGRMDSLLDFDFNEMAKDFVLGNIRNVELQLIDRNNAIDNNEMLGSFLSSHDENGFLYSLINDNGVNAETAAGLAKVAATLQITAKGQPVIYYGEEIGQSGANNYPAQENRADLDWTEAAKQMTEEDSFYSHYQKLLNIRKDYSEVFAKGSRTLVAASDAQGYDVVLRKYEGTSLYVAMNIAAAEASASFAVSGKAGSVYTDLYSGSEYTVAEDCTVTVAIPAAAKGGTAVLVLTEGEEEEVTDTNQVTVKLHYNRADGDYTDWTAWMWLDGQGGADYEFVEENGEMVATITVEGRANNTVYYIIRRPDWTKDVDADQKIDISDVVSGTVHFYVESGVKGGTRVLGADAILGVKVTNVVYDNLTNQITVTTSLPIEGSTDGVFTLVSADGAEVAVTAVKADGSKYVLSLDQDLSDMQEMMKTWFITYQGYQYRVTMPEVYSSEEFEAAYTYEGDDLGATWSAAGTTFKVWAPTAESVSVKLYESGTAGTDDCISTVPMTKGEKGVWEVTVEGDLNGTYYTYVAKVNGVENEACDPYARTTGVNGNRAMVIDLDSTDPEGWDKDMSPNAGMSYTDAVIYELHVRDLSIDPSSGVSEENRGKFLAFTETGTTNATGQSTALDHMVDLGVTHVHLLPVYDYATVDETKLDTEQFNWGYDPKNYNVPEGSYSTDPYNGEVRVKEMKEMVQSLHENGINVIMDVVYNHVSDAGAFCFNQLVPQYFSRMNADGTYSNGSGCGNDTASERAMVSKYIVDSVKYWADEYHIDGFRFDLVGLIDVDTINAVVEEVHKTHPDVIFYGEGWTMSTTVSKDNVDMATQTNSEKTPGFAYFSDTIRDLLKGSVFDAESIGYISGASGQEDLLAQCFTAATSWCKSPTQTINYASCHDNYTLKDKLNVSRADASEEDRIKMNNLAAAIYMTAEGIPLIHAGEEMLRTKVDEEGNIIHNSYNSSDYVNSIKWNTLADEAYQDVFEYYKGLIEFRKNHAALRLTTAEEVAENIQYKWISENVVMFVIEGNDSIPEEVSEGIVVIFNANPEAESIDLYDYQVEEGNWQVCIDDENAGIEVLNTVADGQITVDPISAMVLVLGETEDTDSIYEQIEDALEENQKEDKIAVEKVTVDWTALNLAVGKTYTLVVTVSPANATDQKAVWTTSNSSVATVDANGNVTAVGAGTATITVTVDGVSASCQVTVHAAGSSTGSGTSSGSTQTPSGDTGSTSQSGSQSSTQTTVKPVTPDKKGDTTSPKTSDESPEADAEVQPGEENSVIGGTAADGAVDTAITALQGKDNTGIYVTLGILAVMFTACVVIYIIMKKKEDEETA